MIEVSLTTFQRTVLSALVGENEKMVSSGELTTERATTLRWLIAQTLTAFRMPAIYERVSNDDETPAQLALNEALNRGDADALR